MPFSLLGCGQQLALAWEESPETVVGVNLNLGLMLGGFR